MNATKVDRPITKAEHASLLMRRRGELKAEIDAVQSELDFLRREMGHPSDAQIESAASRGKTIVRGCIQDP